MSESHNLKTTTALGVVCDSCGDVVFPEHKETVEEMHNTECSECDSGLLRMKNMNVVRVSSVIDQIQRAIDERKSLLCGDGTDCNSETCNQHLGAIQECINLREDIGAENAGEGGSE